MSRGRSFQASDVMFCKCHTLLSCLLFPIYKEESQKKRLNKSNKLVRILHSTYNDAISNHELVTARLLFLHKIQWARLLSLWHWLTNLNFSHFLRSLKVTLPEWLSAWAEAAEIQAICCLDLTLCRCSIDHKGWNVDRNATCKICLWKPLSV